MFKLLSIIYIPIAYFILFSSFIILVLPVSFIVAPFKNWGIRLKLSSPFWKIFGQISIYLVCLCRNYLEDYRPIEEQQLNNPPGLYIANHQSFIDIPLLLLTCQIPPIMKKELLYIPIFGVCAYSSSAMIVDRKKMNSRKRVFLQAKERLTTEYRNLQYYPEGTRQQDNKGPRGVKDLKTPLMSFAYKENLPVYPVSIYGTRNVLSKFGFINFGKRVGKIMHSPVYPKDYDNADDFINAAWSKVSIGYNQLEAKLN